MQVHLNFLCQRNRQISTGWPTPTLHSVHTGFWNLLQSAMQVLKKKKKFIEASKRLTEQQGGFSTSITLNRDVFMATKSCSLLLSHSRLQWQNLSLKIGSLFTDDVETYIKSTFRTYFNGIIKLPRKEHNRGRNTALTKENLMLCQSRRLVHMTSELCCSGGQCKSSSCHFLSLSSIFCHCHYFPLSWIKNNGKEMIGVTIISSANSIRNI